MLSVATPAPDSGTVVGPPVASVVTVRLPELTPDAAGVNVMLMVQVPPAVIDVPQVLVWAKSPVAAIEETVASAVPVLEIVTLWASDVAPTLVVGKPMAFRLAESVDDMVSAPTPDRATVIGPLTASLVTVNEPGPAPAP